MYVRGREGWQAGAPAIPLSPPMLNWKAVSNGSRVFPRVKQKDIRLQHTDLGSVNKLLCNGSDISHRHVVTALQRAIDCVWRARSLHASIVQRVSGTCPPKVPLSSWGSWPHMKHSSCGLRVHTQNLFSSAIFAGVTVVTDRPHYSMSSNSPHLAVLAMRN